MLNTLVDFLEIVDDDEIILIQEKDSFFKSNTIYYVGEKKSVFGCDFWERIKGKYLIGVSTNPLNTCVLNLTIR